MGLAATYYLAPLRSKPMVIFHQIARQAGIAPGDEWLLVRIGRQQALPTPLTLLLSPGTFNHYAQAYLRALPARRRSRLTGRIDRLSWHLFEEDVG